MYFKITNKNIGIIKNKFKVVVASEEQKKKAEEDSQRQL